MLQFVALFDLVDSDGEKAVLKLEEEFGKDRTGFYAGDITIDSEVEGKNKKLSDKKEQKF